ncbi:Glycosyl transferases group 1 [Niabella drilacis]|uniref:Glycosyl transferases group 1 n=2 Tax=Niabella drilacis (strain DSM 25811 / CCM 8410 / CCUG 62505 / LMG 26954 / E90) TaxID=1285928 RepID=A0A1G6X263_NIADE|nr:Glycosyl transferases group 1 [Niabella drilacis]
MPSPVSYKWDDDSEKKYATIIVTALSAIILQFDRVIFHVNFMDGLSILTALKLRYKHPAAWQSLFSGNKKRRDQLNDMPPGTAHAAKLFAQEKRLYELSDLIISVTGYMKDFLEERYSLDPKKITVIPNGLNYRRFQVCTDGEKRDLKARLGFASFEKIVLFTGRIDQCKGIDFLIDAFEEACSRENNLRLVIVGEGRIESMIQKPGFMIYGNSLRLLCRL